MQSILVSQPSDLSIAWAQRVINQHHSDIVVAKVDILSVDVGTTTRIRINVGHNRPHLFPERWFVKLPSLAWQAKLITALPRLLHTEVRFYNEVIRPDTLRVPHFLAGQSQFGKGAVLILSDLMEVGSVPGNPSDALTFTQAAGVVRQLANFHAHFWNKEHYAQHYQWLAGPVRRLEDFLGTAFAVPLMKRGLRKAAALVPLTLHAQAINYARQRKQVMHFLQDVPRTLVHHDCHPGNLFWNESKPGLLDWQLVRFGEGISDIAYFLATSLNPESRRQHEIELIKLYAQCLKDHGIESIDFDALFDRYRAHLIYPFEAMLVTLAIGGMMDIDCNHELIRRTTAAVSDLDAFAVLPCTATL
ncbi:MAG: phosphotransferase [Methylococcales bacterium]